MKLSYHYHIPALITNNTIKTSAQQGLFLDSLAIHFDEIICYLYIPRKDELELMDYNLEHDNIHIVNIGPHRPIYLRNFFPNKRLTEIYNADIVLVRGPSPILPSLIRKARQIPTVALLVGDYTKGIDELPQPYWRILLIKLWLTRYKIFQDRVLQKSLLLVNSQWLLNEYKSKVNNIRMVATTTISDNDFYYRDDTCLNQSISILYTGRFDRQKGIEDIANAIIVLIKKGYDLKFSVAGFGDSKDKVIANVTNLFKRIEKLSSFSNHGYKKLGPELYELYRNSDIFITASRLHEGFPRTIREAFSQSLPVITTNIGGISLILKDREHALLCEPKKPELIAEKIKELIENQSLRKNIIKNGHNFAKDYTLEKTGKEIANHIKWWGNNKESQKLL